MQGNNTGSSCMWWAVMINGQIMMTDIELEMGHAEGMAAIIID